MQLFIKKNRVLDSRFATNMEVMNEVTINLMTYNQILFTQYVDDPEARYQFGFSHSAICLTNLTFHLVFLIRGSLLLTKHKCKRCYRRGCCCFERA